MTSTQMVSVQKKRQMFTKEQDQLLINLVAASSEKPNWRNIAEAMGKTSKQCRERYRTYLAPNVSNTEWTEEEDERLRSLVQEIGKHWCKLREYFPGRSDGNIKNRYNFHIESYRKQKKLQKMAASDANSSVDSQSCVFDESIFDMFNVFQFSYENSVPCAC